MGAGCALEGKKAEETSSRKSTPRTLKGVDQQYPPVSVHATRGVISSACHVQKLSPLINVELVGSEEVFGRHADGVRLAAVKGGNGLGLGQISPEGFRRFVLALLFIFGLKMAFL